MERDRYRINTPQVLHEQFDDDVVLVNLENGNYYSLNASGSAILRLLANGLSPDSIEKQSSAADAAAGSCVRALLAELLSEGLITPCDASEPIEVKEETTAAGLDLSTPPALQRFTDMQDLLLLDPIHDVDDRGWPSAINDGQHG
jgi:hypothetical protein